MALIVTVDADEKGVMHDWSITETANGRNNLTCNIPSRDGTYRPSLDEEIIFEKDSERLFGGLIQTPTETGLSDGTIPINTNIDAIDFNALVDRRYLTAEIPAGTLKDALIVVAAYLSANGVTLDPAQANGPTLPALSYRRRKVGDVMTELSTLSGYPWEINYFKVLSMWPIGSRSAPFNIAPGGGHVQGEVTASSSRASAGMVYANRVVVIAGTPEVPIEVEANDIPEQTAHGLWEIVIEAPTVFDTAVAQALADAYLLQRTPTPKTVTYTTRTPGLRPGQVQTINIPWRGVNNVFLISEVYIFSEEGNIVYQVTALEGAVFQPGWRNLYQQWLSPLTQVSIVPSTGGYGRTVFYLGGTYTTWVQWESAWGALDWVPVDGKPDDAGTEVILDTVSRGSNQVTVTARLRAISGGVTARLRNVTDNIVVGTSALVNSTTFVTVVFTCTLTNGSKIYRLELLPTLADTDVQAGHSYLE